VAPEFAAAVEAMDRQEAERVEQLIDDPNFTLPRPPDAVEGFLDGLD
jgi:hypothetical protein